MALDTYRFTLKAKQVPLPNWLRTVIFSPSLSMINWAMDNPKPVPVLPRDLSTL